MRPTILLALTLLAPCVFSFGWDHKWKKDKLLELEHLTMSGQKTIPLVKEEEKKANNIIMDHKKREYDEGVQDTTKFLPYKKFHKAKHLIEKSTLFKILKKFPKGANLHTHLEAMGSIDIVLKLTKFDNLFACKKNDLLRFKFTRDPDDSCTWKPVQTLRDDSVGFEEVLRKMAVLDSESIYETNPNKTREELKKATVTIIDIIRYRPIFQMYINESLYELYKDNVFYVELRSSLPKLYDLDGTEYPEVETARLILEASREFAREYPKFYGVRLIYNPCIENKAKVEQYAKIAVDLHEKFPNFLAGVDFSNCGNNDFHLDHKEESLLSLKKHGINIFAHASRSYWFGCDDTDIFDAILLGAKRVAGLEAILKHPEAMKMLKLKGTPLEIIPISSQVLGYVQRIPNHPASYLIVEDFPLVIGNGKPMHFGSKGVSYDWYEFFLGIASKKHDLKLLKQVAMNSIEHSSMPLKEKLIAIKGWHKEYDEFVEWLIKTDLSKDRDHHHHNHTATDNTNEENEDLENPNDVPIVDKANLDGETLNMTLSMLIGNLTEPVDLSTSTEVVDSEISTEIAEEGTKGPMEYITEKPEEVQNGDHDEEY